MTRIAKGWKVNRTQVAVGLGVLLAGCAPASYVVLLDSPDGGAGEIVVQTPRGAATLSDTGGALALTRGGARPATISEERLQQDFGAAMAVQPPSPQKFILYFETGGARLTPESEAFLDEILRVVREHPAPDISVTGHTDTVGSARENERLSLARARFVAEWLRASEVEAIEFTIASHGQRDLLIPTADGVDEPRNRRVEVTVR